MADRDVDADMVLKTTFLVPKMDCPSEERLIRLALGNLSSVKNLAFDFDSRTATIWHSGDAKPVLDLLLPLNLGAAIQKTTSGTLPPPETGKADPAAEKKVLTLLLLINASMFVFEFVTGWLADSTGLIADSADMLADAIVYSLSLYAVGRTANMQAQAARLSGYFQMLLAFGVIAEVVRRYIYGSEPESYLMITISGLALIANISCMALLAKHRTGAVHMKASWIFSTNDVLANIGVIVAGILVLLSGSALPDLVIGSLISVLVFIGAVRILRLSDSAASNN